MSEQIDELEDGKADVEKKFMRANSEVTQMKAKFEQDVSVRLEELEDAKWVLYDSAPVTSTHLFHPLIGRERRISSCSILL